MLDMVWVQAGCVICIPAFMLGGLVAAQMPTWTGVAACGVGYLLTLILMIVLGIQGLIWAYPLVQCPSQPLGKRNQTFGQFPVCDFPDGIFSTAGQCLRRSLCQLDGGRLWHPDSIDTVFIDLGHRDVCYRHYRYGRTEDL